MSSGNVFETLFKQLAAILKLVVDGKRDPEEVSGVLQTIIDGKDFDISSTLSKWHAFYRKFFGIELELSGIKIPECKPGFNRVLVIAKGLTLNQVYDVLAEQFPCWRCVDDLDKGVPKNDRTTNQTYAIRVRDRVEADEELKNLSADQLKEKGVVGITLLERMIFELKYWDETAKHLDINNWTLCAGSRGSVGRVPRAGWHGGGFRVGWCRSGGCGGFVRSRSVVSCPA